LREPVSRSRREEKINPSGFLTTIDAEIGDEDPPGARQA